MVRAITITITNAFQPTTTSANVAVCFGPRLAKVDGLVWSAYSSSSRTKKVNAARSGEGVEGGGDGGALTIWLKFNKLYEMLS